MANTSTPVWGDLLIGQLAFYWDAHLRPRLEGLTDEEYFWEPVPGCLSVRPDPAGNYRVEPGSRDADPSPVTTIAWRMMHIAVGCFVTRSSTFFGDGSAGDGADMFDPRHVPADLPHTAKDAVAFLDASYREWHGHVSALGEAALSAPLGPKGAYFSAGPMAALIAHVNRETMHHGGEIGVLRDLFRATGATRRTDRLAATSS
ncbi:DinB family protein [Dactylosporangium sp. NPDC000521]|uniref:DinB family protein n=1 Tax=Dactylosporangium sp. NPDC000521 TaxID=3363975 RepID=UPI00369ECB6D